MTRSEAMQMLDSIEAAVGSEQELRRLVRQVARDDSLGEQERTFLAGRAAFYIADQFGRGEADVVQPDE